MVKGADGPQQDRAGAPRESTTVSTPVGSITVSASDRAVLRVEWAGRSSETATAIAASCETAGASPAATSERLLAEAADQLHRYFDGSLTVFDLTIELQGVSDIARTVLTTLAETVERGTTITYGELAGRSGTGIPARAVGGIMGLNPIPIIVPCHRVVRSDGLGGYSGGLPGTSLETKRWLLEFEDALPPMLF
ncbi:methylated-DNA--[protein]-cysteine S-methyltransferase [Brevibacterium marinum]|uniref:Methylated-DNA--protein-cysteine methyltransferase n=1 Tax=Brevibacterium marinum TaxID=418643 RepID=A0A846S0Z7_9MICO|nr:methylated-DNA--[protein]-cysteine S-methyltransferase [Brevibacterium marinum]NJC55851.1 methylated-DNA-[protein]-cysteine S-methyltransferase [Brevibacterium marinum]